VDADFGPPRFGWYGGPRRAGAPDPNMRVSDAERTQMADELSKHYADGRLDEAEFKVRLDKAMSAKTRSDLSGLLVDLPTLHAAPPRPRHMVARRVWWALSAIAIVALVLALSSALAPPHIPWVLVIVVLALLWHRRSWRYGHHHRREPVL
jgi:hypothetical protein